MSSIARVELKDGTVTSWIPLTTAYSAPTGCATEVVSMVVPSIGSGPLEVYAFDGKGPIVEYVFTVILRGQRNCNSEMRDHEFNLVSNMSLMYCLTELGRSLVNHCSFAMVLPECRLFYVTKSSIDRTF